MTNKTYISPVGTSLLVNFYRVLGTKYESKYGNISEWARLSPDDYRNTPPDGDVCRAINDNEFVNDMVSFVTNTREKSCAEVNGLLSVKKVFSHEFKDVEVILLYTKTCNTMLVSMVLEKALRLIGFPVVNEVELTGISSVERFDQGLLEVLDKVSMVIRERKSRNWKIYVNATPGFKAETTFIAIVSLVMGVDSIVYVHESFNQPVIIPSIPIEVKKSDLMELLNIFGEEDKLHVNAVKSILPEEEYLDYLDKGLLYKQGEYVYIRPWLRTLIKST